VHGLKQIGVRGANYRPAPQKMMRDKRDKPPRNYAAGLFAGHKLSRNDKEVRDKRDKSRTGAFFCVPGAPGNAEALPNVAVLGKWLKCAHYAH
jgi:hypothetical protein